MSDVYVLVWALLCSTMAQCLCFSPAAALPPQEQHYDAECAPTASAEEAAAMARGGPCRDLVFVKKWVGTKHAVLFRLSNKSVQVCDSGEGEAVRHDLTPAARQVKFKDGTSVTLGAGAKMVRTRAAPPPPPPPTPTPPPTRTSRRRASRRRAHQSDCVH